MNFYQDVIINYSQITFPIIYEEVSKINKHIAWYLADNTDQYVTCDNRFNNIIEIDIKSAFPTICNNMFDLNCKFIQELNNIKDKKEKNIYIATNLKNSGELHIINNICKMIILGIIFDSNTNDNIVLLELKKDGAVISCDNDTLYRLMNLDKNSNPFTKFIINKHFIFHIDYYERYIRANRTSIFKKTDDVIIKGSYKYIPNYLKTNINNILYGKELNINEVLTYYNSKYFKVVQAANLIDILNDKYICENKKILNIYGKYETYTRKSIINPQLYLQLFLYPIILSLKT